MPRSPKHPKKDVFTKREKCVLLGTLLGDGTIDIYKGYSNARMQITHSITQTEWFEWKTNELKALGTENSVHLIEPSGFSSKQKWHFQTRALPILTKLMAQTHKQAKVFLFCKQAKVFLFCLQNKVKVGQGTKIRRVISLERTWLKGLNTLSLMVWWFDDGGLIGKGSRRGRWNTQGFKYRGAVILQSYLEDVWGIETTIQVCWSKIDKNRKSLTIDDYVLDQNAQDASDLVDGEADVNVANPPGNVRRGYNKHFYLQLKTRALKSLLRLIMPHVQVKSMVYKTFLVYVDEGCQQSWMAEMKQAMPQFSEEIDRLYKKTRRS
jgi:hypothetical protein